MVDRAICFMFGLRMIGMEPLAGDFEEHDSLHGFCWVSASPELVGFLKDGSISINFKCLKGGRFGGLLEVSHLRTSIISFSSEV